MTQQQLSQNNCYHNFFLSIKQHLSCNYKTTLTFYICLHLSHNNTYQATTLTKQQQQQRKTCILHKYFHQHSSDHKTAFAIQHYLQQNIIDQKNSICSTTSDTTKQHWLKNNTCKTTIFITQQHLSYIVFLHKTTFAMQLSNNAYI